MGEKKAQQTRAKIRAFHLDVRDGENGEEPVIRASVSSEAPCPQWVFDGEREAWVRANEILGHTQEEIDLSRCEHGLVVQDTHEGDQIGLIREVRIEDGKLGGNIEWCSGQRAQEIKADAVRGLRTNMSVGYMVDSWEKVADGEVSADGRRGLPTYRATRWTPYEASFVNVPADIRVGVGRELDTTETAETPAAKTEEESNMDAPKDTPAVETPAVDTGAELRALKEEVVLLRDALKKPAMPAAKTATPFSEGEQREVAKRYSLSRAIMGMVDPKNFDNGFERECSEQIAKATRKSANGLFVPEVALRTWTGKNNVASHITGSGSNVVETELLASQYIDALVAETVLGKAGVSTMAGLVGDIDIPTISSVTAGWQSAEDGDATTVSPTFGKISGTPHTVTGTAIVSRKLTIQSSIGVDALLSRLLTGAIARAIETAGFEGSGENGQPTGLASTSGVGSVSMTADAPTKANMVDFWKTVLAANAGTDSLKYIMSPAVKALLCQTMDVQLVKNVAASENVGGVGGGYLCTREGKVEGYDVLMSGLCNAKKIYFGNWSDLILAFWTGIDLIVDPYTYSAKGGLQLSAFQDCDILCRHSAAFAIGTALS